MFEDKTKAKGERMTKKRKSSREDSKKAWENDISTIKMLLVLLVNKMGVNKTDIARTLGISEGRLSQLLNPRKYKK